MKQTCENCKWHEHFNGACLNGGSEYVADFTDSDFSCEHWEGKEESGNDKL